MKGWYLLGVVALVTAGFFAVRYYSLHRIRDLRKREAWSDQQYLGAFAQSPDEPLALAIRDTFAEFTELEPDRLRPGDSLADSLKPVLYFDDDGSDLLEVLQEHIKKSGDEEALDLLKDLNLDTVTRAAIEEITHFFANRRRIYCVCGYDLRGSGARCSECGQPTVIAARLNR